MSDESTVDSTLVADLNQQLAACQAELRQTRIECDEALRQQAASAEILEIINRSPGDLAPVFDAILERATRIGEAKFGIIYRFDGEVFRVQAVRDANPAFLDYLRREPPRPDLRNALGRALQAKHPIHITDIKAEPAYAEREPSRVAAVEIAGARTFLAVPMLRDDRLIGVIAIYRQEVRPFSTMQIELAQTLANHASIAIENARLLGELSERTRDVEEALEYQTAVSDVLKVISGSAFDLQPVLDTVIETAARLCAADDAGITLRDAGAYRYVATTGVSSDYSKVLSGRSFEPGRGTMAGRVALEGTVVHIADITADPDYVFSGGRTVSRTLLGVPLLREGAVVGTLTLSRQRVEPFTPRQVELVQTFADQAVIAVENARLLTETREALEQQTATAEVLGVISSAPGKLQPVFEKLLESALRLCNAHMGVISRAIDGAFTQVAKLGAPPEFTLALADYRPPPHTPLGQMLATKSTIQVRDYAETQAYAERVPQVVAMVEQARGRSALQVPLLREDEVVGSFTIYRSEVRAFVDKEVALLENFAKQAVIAIENARLLGELNERTDDLEEALKYQTATSDVLKVISGSAFDLQPVLDTVIDTAMRLCDADFAGITLRDGDVYRYVATSSSTSSDYDAVVRGHTFSPGRGSVIGRVALERKVAHIADITADPEYKFAPAADIAKVHTTLGVPMFREGEVIGVIALARAQVKPFTERQIKLMRTFADQAVIAIENARLITETREALEQQTATTGLLQVINASPGNLTPVFEAMLDKALRLCDASFGTMQRNDNGHFHMLACRNVPAPFEEFLSQPMRALSGGSLDRLLHGEAFVQIVDVREGDQSTTGRRALVELAQARTVVWIPLRKDSTVLGTFVIYRTEVKPFSDKQIALLQNFAAQAVIAMDNARLLGELRERQAELRVTFDNMGDGVALFDSTPRLVAWNRNFQQILDLPDALLEQHLTYPEYIRMLADRGEFGALENIEEELKRRLVSIDRPALFARTRPDGKVIEARRNPVPGGGFVLIYSDITERKRAEAKIRAARDAAEAALRELKAAQANLIHAEKMASLGQLTAGIAHEIKNPLNFVNNFAGLSNELLAELKDIAAPALKTLDDDQRAELDEVVGMLAGNLDKIVEHGRRADGIVKSMLAHSRGGSGDRQAVDLNALVEESLNLAYHGARAQDQNFNITLERDFDPAIKPIELVPQDITRVFLNLFGNGLYAANKRARAYTDGSFRPVLRVGTHDAGDTVEIRVRDNGVGIPAEIRDKLFQPFFTTKPTGEGTGLGLSISYDIVTQQHGGAIAVDSEEGVFTEFTVRLPRGAGALPAKELS